MMMSVEVRWDLLGAQLATLGEEEQSQFFAGFARELDGYDTHYHREVQMIAIGDKLDNGTRRTLARYLPGIWGGESEG